MPAILDLELDEAAHAYSYRGRRIQSVTQALHAAGLVDYSWCTEFALWRGSKVHKAIHVELTDGLDWSTVPESFQPFISAATQYIADQHAEVVEVERRVLSEAHWYAGTLDAIIREHARCACGLPKRLVELDWKTGQPVKATGLQLAAYACAYFEETRQLVQERRAVQLLPSGDYKATTYDDRADRDRFLAALTVADLRRQWGLIEEAA
jgi:hypothetical protein